MKTDLFQSYGNCWDFQICWHIEYSTFIASSFRIWNSSSGIPSPPLVLFMVMLPKAHLSSYSKMSGSRWGITPSWLSGSWRSSLYSSSVYCCHLSYPSPSEGRQTENHNHRKLTKLITWTRALSNSMKPWAMPYRNTKNGQVMVKSSDKTWSSGEGNANHFSILALRTPWKWKWSCLVVSDSETHGL